jgi:hypothetical protein
MDDGVVYLNPRFYRPGTIEGRYLLGHEVAHVAQSRRNGGDIATELPVAEAVLEAELEADRIGRAAEASRHLGVLPPGRPPIRMLATRETSRSNWMRSGRSRRPPFDPRERARADDRLCPTAFRWAITDEDVRKVLVILQTVSMVTAHLSANLPRKYRHRLGNLDTDHYKHHRAQLASYWAERDRARPFSGEMKKAFETWTSKADPRGVGAQYAIGMNPRRKRLQGSVRGGRDHSRSPDDRDEARAEEATRKRRSNRPGEGREGLTRGGGFMPSSVAYPENHREQGVQRQRGARCSQDAGAYVHSPPESRGCHLAEP